MFLSRILLCLVVLVLPLSSFAQTAPPKEGTGVVAGRVLLNGNPARGVQVALQKPQGSGPFDLKGVKRVTTDETGQFRFERLPAGQYILGAIAPGFVVQSDSKYGARGKNLNLSEGEISDALELNLKPGGVITGRVTDAHGTPVVGEGVELSRINEQGKFESTYFDLTTASTDDRGIYRLFGVPAGRYLVHVGFEHQPNSLRMTMERVFYRRTYHPGVTERADAKIVEISEGSEATGIDITVEGLKRNYDITGRAVLADSGRPAVGVNVHYGSMDKGEKRIGAWGSSGIMTDAEGAFRLPNVLPGRYAVFVSTDKAKGYYCDPVPFEIRDAEVTGLEIRLSPGASISGVAVVEGGADPATLAKLAQFRLGIRVDAPELTSPAGDGEGQIAPDGSFQFTGLRAGRASLSPSYSSPDRLFEVLRIERDGVVQRDGLLIGPAERITGVRVILAAGTGVLVGDVKLKGGELPPTVRLFVNARRTDSNQAPGTGGTVDMRGGFRIERLPAGEYDLTITSYFTSEEAPPGYAEFQERLKSTTQRIAIGNGQEVRTMLTLDLGRKEGNQ